MKNIVKSKLLISLSLIAGILISVFGGLFYFNLNQKNNKIIEADEVPQFVTVHKIFKNQSGQDEIRQTINACGENIMLNDNEQVYVLFNEYFDIDNIDVDKDTLVNTENIFLTLQINAYLNGKQIKTNESINQTPNAQTKSYNHILTLNDDVLYTDGTTPDTLEGTYKFVFAYSQKVGNDILPQVVSTVYFNLVNVYSYINEDQSVINEARLYNTKKVNNYSTTVEYNYFNFNNEGCVNYARTNIDTTNPTTLLFPTISYDVTKYNISYVKTLYGVGEFHDYILTNETTDQFNTYYEVEHYVNDILVETLLFENTTTNNIEITDIGEYDIVLNFVVKTFNYNTNQYEFLIDDGQLEDSCTVIKAEHNADIARDIKLYVYGYQLYYSDYSQTNLSANKEFKSADHITDVSFRYSNSSMNEMFTNKTALTIDSDKIATTNQAPVSLSYYAEMSINASQNFPNSYYLYWETWEDYKNGNTIQEYISNNTKFTKNGYYQLLIEYSFQNYKQDEGEYALNLSSYQHYQVFVFRINNQEPQITVNQLDSTNNATDIIVATNSFINTGALIKWRANTEFDIKPRIIIEKQIFGTDYYVAIEEKDYEANGLVINNDVQFEELNENNELIIVYYDTLKINKIDNGDNINGYYKIVVEYGPGSTSKVAYRFTIDCQDIIKTAYAFNSNESLYNNTIIVSEDAETLQTNLENFIVYWQEKASGAQISATYNFLPLDGEMIDSFAKTQLNVLTEVWEETFDQNNQLTNTWDNPESNLPMVSNTSKIDDIFTATMLKNISHLSIVNGYGFNSINVNVPYEYSIKNKQVNDNGNLVFTFDNKNTIRYSQGLYLFNISDQAGNATQLAFLVDRTRAIGIKYVEGETQYALTTPGVSSRDTLIAWGETKALTIDTTNSDIITTIEQIKALNVFNIKDDNSRLLIDYSNTNFSTNQNITENVSNKSQILRVRSYNDPSTNEWYRGDKTYDITFVDEIGNTYQFTQKVTSDNSMLLAYTTDTENIDENTITSFLDVNEVSNKNVLSIEWFENKGTEYEVSEISYKYFPLTFEENSPNYPYAKDPAVTKVLDFSEAVTSLLKFDGITTTANKIMLTINVEGNQTPEGMYIITRKYKNDLQKDAEGNASGDYSPRDYLFFIDRNAIVSRAITGNLIGEQIGITLSNNNYQTNYQKIFKGADLLLNSNHSQEKFSTSKLPAVFYDVNLLKGLLNKFDNSNSPFNGSNLSEYMSIIKNTYKLNTPTVLFNEVENDFNEINSNVRKLIVNENFKFDKNGYYKITLTDNAGYTMFDIEQGNITNIAPNTFSFIIEIDVNEPIANIIKYTINETSDKKEFISYSSATENISTNNTNMIVGWTDPQSDFEALIDKSTFEITMEDENNNLQTIYKVVNNQIHPSSLIKTLLEIKEITESEKYNFDNPNWQYFIDLTDVLNNLTNEYKTTSAKYSIKLQYIGNEEHYSALNQNKNEVNYYFYTIKNIVLDFKKPEYNYLQLLNNDKFLKNYYNFNNQTDIDTFNDYSSYINFENYAFTVGDNFTINHMPENLSSIFTPEMDNNQVWIRKYDKFNSDNIEDQQSITPDDPRYDDRSLYTNRYRFDENFTLNGQKLYTEISDYRSNEYQTYNIKYILDILGLSSQSGYYEIIERDFAGNYRIYTIFYSNEVTKEIKYEVWETDKAHNTGSTTISNQNNDIVKIYAENLLFTKLIDNNEFVYITITKDGQLVDTIEHIPSNDKQQVVDYINQILTDYNVVNGNVYYIDIKSSLGFDYVIEHRKPGELFPEYHIITGDTGINVNFIVDQSKSAYLSSFDVYLAENGVLNPDNKVDCEEIDLEVDYKNYNYTFTVLGNAGGDYWFIFTDNFGRQIKEHKIIGIEDNTEKIIYSANVQTVSVSNNKIVNYTNGQVQVRYQSRLYQLTITDNFNNVYYANQFPNYALQVNGIVTFDLFDNDTTKATIYTITFVDSAENIQTYNVCYYNELADISIHKSDGTDLKVDENDGNSNEGQIYILIDNSEQLFETIVIATRDYIDSNGKVIIEDLGVIYNEQNFEKLGNYTFTAYNSLGTTKVFKISIQAKISRNYWVQNVISGVESENITPAPQKYSYNGAEIDHYFTIYDYVVKTNNAKGYTYALAKEFEETNYITTVYTIFKDEEIVTNIAVTKVAANNNFLRNYGNSLIINDILQSGYSAKITQSQEGVDKTAYFKITKGYNIVEGNDIVVSYYYNSIHIGQFSLSNVASQNETLLLTLYDSGVYDFYISDLAGNKQSFGNNKYFRMLLLNDILFNINGTESVDNAVFNDKVVLGLQQVNQFDNSRINMLAYLNGNEITLNKVNNTFTFTKYGIYNIILTGSVNGNKIETHYNFRIINKNEAMATYEYVGLNNYEIYKIVRLETTNSETGDDITEEIKQQIQLANESEDAIKYLNTLALSSLQNGIGGAGIYKIFVEARYDTNKPDQKFDFIVWLNNDNDLLIKSSIKYGDSTTDTIILTLNKNQIYNKVGECKIMFNDQEWLIINAETASLNVTEKFSITEVGKYNVRIVTNSGNTLESFVVTRDEPLNAVAIIVIILAIIAAGVLVFIFIKLRKNMRVK